MPKPSNVKRRIHQRIARQIRPILEERFPLAFVGKGQDKKPLRLGIHRDLAAACLDIPKAHLRIALSDYVNGPRYARCMVEGTPRVALDGSLDGVVTKEHAARARAALEAWRYLAENQAERRCEDYFSQQREDTQ